MEIVGIFAIGKFYEPSALFYGNLVQFVFILYVHTFWYVVTRKILQPCYRCKKEIFQALP
jgi:hypothetical protein